jgi:hypothetical protein
LEFAQTQLFTGSELAANARMQQPGESDRALQKQRTKAKADPSLKALRDDNVETKAGPCLPTQAGRRQASLTAIRKRRGWVPFGPATAGLMASGMTAKGRKQVPCLRQAGSSDASRILTRNDSEKAKRRRAPATPESARRTALRLRSERAALQRGKSLRSVSQESRDGT